MDIKYAVGVPDRGLCRRGCPKQSCQLNTYDYLADIPDNDEATDLVEVQFKNTRKGYYHNVNHLPLEKGDIVAVEASPGHDIGTVSLTGRLVLLQMKRVVIRNPEDIKRIYRKARPVDMEKYEEAKALEHETMIRSRQIAKDLGLDMKIGDVEYQGDGQKAIFYYIADGRVDFRQLIKDLAAAFHIRIEMKQIGARQEAGRIGGFGPCGRELCCTTWMKNFVSVSTAAARFQDLGLNPQKLAGQCAKLKCCMNYEVDQYVEASRRLPSREVVLETLDSDYYYFKADILSNMVTYSTDRRLAANLVTISSERAFEIIAMNREGKKPEALDNTSHPERQRPIDLATQEDLTRFDSAKKKKKKKSSSQRKDDGQPRGEKQQQNDKPHGDKKPREDKQPREEKQPREDRPQREDKQPREDRQPREERQPREDKQPREDRQPHGDRPRRGDRPHRNEPRAEKSDDKPQNTQG